MEKQEVDRFVLSFGSGCNLPVSDPFCLLVETYVKLSKNAPKINRINHVFHSSRKRKFGPIVVVKKGSVVKSIGKGYEECFRCFGNDEAMNSFPELRKSDEKLMRKEVMNLEKCLIPVVVYLWYVNLENFNHVTKKNLLIQFDLGWCQKFFFPRSFRKEILLQYFPKNYSILEYIAMLKDCVSRISKLLKTSTRNFLFGKTPSLLDVYVFSLFSSILFPKFPVNPFMSFLKEEKELVTYVNRIKKTLFPIVSPSTISVDRLSSVKDTKDEEYYKNVAKKGFQLRGKTIMWVSVSLIAFAVFVKVQKYLPKSMFWFLSKKKKKKLAF